jgi:hypothetical protein
MCVCVCVVEERGARVNCVTGAPTYRLSVVSGTDIPRNKYLGVGCSQLLLLSRSYKIIC